MNRSKGGKPIKPQDKQYKVNKLFIFGAGASFAATRKLKHSVKNDIPRTQIPLDAGFTSALLDLSDGRRSWIDASLKFIKESWQDPVLFEDMGLEEAILAQSANIKFDQKNTQIHFDDYLKHLVHLIAVRLKQARQGDEKLYEKFAAQFFKNKRTTHRIITFNYDDILDRILLDNHRYTIGALYSDTILPEQNATRTSMVKNPMMIKMHGSVNWNCTSDDIYRIVENDMAHPPHKRALHKIWYRKDGCPAFEDGGGHSPCIIPPIDSKPVAEIPQFKNFWDKASEYLSECKEIYICGYSLPPTDVFARALFKRFKNTRLKKITIIDPDYSVVKTWRKMLVRPPNVNKVEWSHFEDFGEFIDWAERKCCIS